MLYTTIHNLFKQHFVSWNGLLLNATNELQIPTEGQGPGGDLPQKFMAGGAQIRYFWTKIRPKFVSQIRYHPDKVLQELPGAWNYAKL